MTSDARLRSHVKEEHDSDLFFFYSSIFSFFILRSFLVFILSIAACYYFPQEVQLSRIIL
jgi:hypothetical protein